MNEDKIINIIIDIWKLTPVQVYKKHGIGFQTQNKISKMVDYRMNKIIKKVKTSNRVE